jgi:hypothetical protein
MLLFERSKSNESFMIKGRCTLFIGFNLQLLIVLHAKLNVALALL